MITCREYQLEADRELWRGYKTFYSQLLQCPTGGGKTLMAAFLIKMRLQHLREKTLVIAHRREIITNTADKLIEAGIETGIIMAGHAPMCWADAQVASLDTLWAGKDYKGFPDAQFVVIDEAHRAGGKRYRGIIEHYKQKGAKILLLTATPMRNDGYGLGQLAERMVRTPDVPWMIQNGFLVPVEYWQGIIPKKDGVSLAAKNFTVKEKEAVLNGKLLIGNTQENWHNHASGLRTMLFAPGVKTSIHYRDEFLANGIKAAHIDGETDKAIRDHIIAQMNYGEIQVICNAMVYAEGTDIPCLECLVDTDPTHSLIEYLQKGGRILRPFPGKTKALYLDHSGNVYQHGRLELPRDWELTEGKEQVEKLAEQRKKTELIQISCKVCGFMFNAAICPLCGTPVHQLEGKSQEFLPADLVKMTEFEYEEAIERKKLRNTKQKRLLPKVSDEQAFYSGLLDFARRREWKDGWAKIKYKEKYGSWPNGLDDRSMTPRKAVKEFIRESMREWREQQKAAKEVAP